MMVKKAFVLSACLLASSPLIVAESRPGACTFREPGSNSEPRALGYDIEGEAKFYGEEAVHFLVDACMLLGRGLELKKALDQLRVKDGGSVDIFNSRVSPRLQLPFMKGILAGLEKINIDEFVAKCHLAKTREHAVLIEDAYHFLLKHLRALVAQDPQDWGRYCSQHTRDALALWAKLFRAFAAELNGGALQGCGRTCTSR